MKAARDLYSLFDSLRPLFPGGIPRRLIDAAGKQQRSVLAAQLAAASGAPSVRVLGASDAPIVFVGSWEVSSEGELYSGTEGELLKGAIEKGLRLDVHKVLVIWASQESAEPGAQMSADLSAALAERLAEIKKGNEGDFSARVFILLGAKDPKFFSIEQIEEIQSNIQGAHVIPTYSLTAILKDEQKKRSFWKDLKAASSIMLGAPARGV